MKRETKDVLLGIFIILIITVIAILFCLKVFNKDYIYKLKYYQGENLYIFNITDDYDLRMDVYMICKEEKCAGYYNSVISTSNNASKKDAEELMKSFDLHPEKITEKNEENITENQKEIISKIIG